VRSKAHHKQAHKQAHTQAHKQEAQDGEALLRPCRAPRLRTTGAPVVARRTLPVWPSIGTAVVWSGSLSNTNGISTGSLTAAGSLTAGSLSVPHAIFQVSVSGAQAPNFTANTTMQIPLEQAVGGFREALRGMA
jgi:hypothetical protein